MWHTELVERYFTVLITDNANSKKKHKKVDDGILCIKGLRGTLKSLEGKDIYSRLFPPNSRFVIGAEFEMARNLVELVAEFPADDFTSGRIFVQSGNVAPSMHYRRHSPES
jgi:hypothetical protein